MLNNNTYFAVVFVVALVIASKVEVAKGKNSIRCYQCTVTNNSQCREEYLKECPDDQAYDICQITIKKTDNTAAVTKRNCALGPCNLRDATVSGMLGMGDCDRSQSNYNCVYCCQGEGCNKDTGFLWATPHAQNVVISLSFCILTYVWW